ncbi:hypothetical protein JCM5350_006772 [Sporobolomyces pararoseus]
MKFTAAALSLVALPTVLAHFTLDYPQTRGFDEDIEPQFCGGFNSTSSTRVPFPVSGSGPILIDSHHPTAQVAVLISFDQNPTSIQQFTKFDNGTSYGLLQNFENLSSEGEYCLDVDISSLKLGVENGTSATIQVEFNGGDGTLFQCTDVILVSDYSAPSNVTSACQQARKINSSSSSSASSSPSTTASGSAPSASSSQGSTSGAEKVGVKSVGAGGVLGLVGIIALVGFF